MFAEFNEKLKKCGIGTTWLRIFAYIALPLSLLTCVSGLTQLYNQLNENVHAKILFTSQIINIALIVFLWINLLKVNHIAYYANASLTIYVSVLRIYSDVLASLNSDPSAVYGSVPYIAIFAIPHLIYFKRRKMLFYGRAISPENKKGKFYVSRLSDTNKNTME